MILDIGPATVEGDHAERLAGLQDAGMERPARRVRDATLRRRHHAIAGSGATDGGRQAPQVAGGGDTVAALAQAGVVEKFSYVSTAGGAFLEWLEGKDLPGVAALKE